MCGALQMRCCTHFTRARVACGWTVHISRGSEVRLSFLDQTTCWLTMPITSKRVENLPRLQQVMSSHLRFVRNCFCQENALLFVRKRRVPPSYIALLGTQIAGQRVHGPVHEQLSLPLPSHSHWHACRAGAVCWGLGASTFSPCIRFPPFIFAIISQSIVHWDILVGTRHIPCCAQHFASHAAIVSSIP